MRTRSHRVVPALAGFIAAGALLFGCSAPAPATPTAAPAKPTSAPASAQASPAAVAPSPSIAVPSPGVPAAKPASGEPIKIGWIGALSGTNAVLGKWDTYGIELAFDEVNARGGINGRPLQLIKYDDEADPTKAVNAATRLISEDKVPAAFATTNSGPTLAVVPVFQRAKVPHLTGSLSAEITQKGSAYVFRDTAAGPTYEQRLVDYLVQKKGYKTFAIITDSTAYGKGQADYQEQEIKKLGQTVTTRETYNPEDKDFTGQLQNILRTNPEVLLFGGSEVASGLIAKQARQLGFTGVLAGGAAIGTPKYIEVAGADVANGTYFSSPFIDASRSEKAKAFAQRYQEKYGEEAESHGAKAYDGAMLLAYAMSRASSLEGEEIAKQLHAIKGFEGVQGVFNFDENGEGINTVDIGIVKDGKLTYAER